MHSRRIIFNINLLVLLLFMLFPYTAKSAVTISELPNYSRLQKEKQLCQQLEDKITNKQGTRKFVKASIQLGYNACGVIKCAINSGGDLKQIIEGAVEAGTTKDVVSRCALNAGVDARDLSVILVAQLLQCNVEEAGLGYSPPDEPNIIIPVPKVPDRFISPSNF